MMNSIHDHEDELQKVSVTPDVTITHYVPFVLLLIGLVITAIAWWQTSVHARNLEQKRLSNQVEQIRNNINGRMTQYVQALRSCVALHDASSDVNRNEWKTFVDKIEVAKWFSGIQAIGLAVPVLKPNLDKFEAEIRSEGFPDFRVRPTDDRENYTAIKYIEPFDWRNQRAFGFDMYSNPVRRRAMDRAATTGLATITGKITLLQEIDKDVQAGILCYLPLYKSGALLNTQDQRKQALEGWVYGAFRCDDLMAGILGEDPSNLSLEIYDTETITPENLLFDSRKLGQNLLGPKATSRLDRDLSTTIPVELFGQNWSVRLSSAPGIFTKFESMISSMIAVGGTLFSLLMFAVLIAVAQQRQRAVQLAQKMTVGLRERELHNRAIVENASEAILTVNGSGTITAANQASHIVFRSQSSLKGKDFNQLIIDTTLGALAKRSRQILGPEVGCTIQARRADGRSFPCRVSVDRVVFSDVLYFVVIVRDQTARVQAAAKLAEQHKQLVDASHRAGKAEVATGVLHNVGNVLNSVNVSASMLRQRIEASPISYLVEAARVLEKHKHDLQTFFTNDRRGKHFPRLLNQLTSSFEKERDSQLSELESLSGNINHIKEIVTLQQSFAKTSGVLTEVNPEELFEEALKMNDSEIQWHTTTIEKNFEEVPLLSTRKHDVIQILVNLLRNAHQAINKEANNASLIRLSIVSVDQHIEFRVQDNGIGIALENLEKIFQHGFTTKNNGHGFGLHSCAIAAQELGGALSVQSDGVDKGATFTLQLPLATASKNDGDGDDIVAEKQSVEKPSPKCCR